MDLYLNEYVKDRLHRCMATNLSENGLYINKLVTQLPRRPDGLQLEFELPGTSETIWARGEIAYEKRENYFHGTGVRLSGMANFHTRLLRDYIWEHKRQHLRMLLTQIRQTRYH